MNVLVVFTPFHDFAMPYLAGPLLKGYVEQHDPKIKITCVDLNIEFVKSAIDNYTSLLNDYRAAMDTESVSVAVRAAVTCQNSALARLEQYFHQYDGHACSLRNYRSFLDRQDFSKCMEYAKLSTPFDRLYFDFLGRYTAPDCFSVSMTVEDQIQPIFRLLYLAHAKWPATPIILGGNLVNRICQFMDLEQLRDLCDYIILREGEIPLLKLLQRISNTHEQDERDPRIIDLQVSKLPTMGELNNLPLHLHTDLNIDFRPNFSDLNIHDYFCPEAILPVSMSRKCYWGRCSFCTIHSAWDPSHRQRNAETVADEIENNIRLNKVKNFRFVDESSPPDLLSNVCKFLRDMGIECTFEIYGILEKRFLDSNFVKNIASTGCRQIFFGLESIDPDTIKRMSKQINRTHDVAKIFKSTASLGVHNYVFTMYGFPGEDLAAQNKTINYIISDRNIHTAIVSNFVAELESPYARSNKNSLIHNGKMTEKYSQMCINGKYISAIKTGAADAERAQYEIYTKRPDLALTAFLNEETRFILSKKFGPDFAQQALAADPLIPDQTSRVFKVISDERIKRQLT